MRTNGSFLCAAACQGREGKHCLVPTHDQDNVNVKGQTLKNLWRENMSLEAS